MHTGNLLHSNERAGGQDIFHFHLHIIPRWHGDGLRLARLPEVRRTMPIKEVAAKISREALGDQEERSVIGR